jgi:putative ABC transport system permease protein
VNDQRIRLRLDRLHAILRESRLTQNHWAIKLGLSRGHWSDIVNAKHPYPSAKTRERMLEVLGVGFDSLFVVEAGHTDSEAAFKAALRDRYLIDEELGHGGMGTVFLARDIRHGRLVAIKMVSAEAVAGIGAKQFLKEIRTTARLQHHHILPLFDSGVAADSPFYVMPYIKDGSLRDRLKQSGRLGLAEALQLMRGMAQALTHAHDAQVLHCDIKPENILLSGDHPFVADFGISRAIHAEVFEWGIRHTIDSSAGTPAYVSPEQASGERHIDVRSDVYSLACMLFEMLAGQAPFSGTTTMETVAQRFTTQVPDVRTHAPEIPYGIAERLQRAMSLAVQRRPESVMKFMTEIENAARRRRAPRGVLARTLSPIVHGIQAVRHFIGKTTGGITLDSIVTDLRFTLRSFRRRPAFALLAILTIGLGIGASTAMFSIVHAVLLRPLEYPDPQSVVSIYPTFPDLAGHPTAGQLAIRGTFSWPEFFAIRENQTSFTGVAAYRSLSLTISGEGTPQRVPIAETNYELFQILHVAPRMGRLFNAEDDPDVAQVALITSGFWRERFGSDSNVVGQAVILNDESVEIVGVLPDNFRVGTMGARIWIPRTGSSTDPGIGNHNINGAVARLTPGVTATQAQSEMVNILQASVPPDHGTHGASVFERLSDETRNSRTPLLALIAGSFLLLAVGCGNVAAILLGAGIDREQELAIRGALGASRGRIVRQLLTESVVLSVVGGVAGAGVAALAMRSLLSFAPAGLPRIQTATIDGTVLMFTLTIAGIAGIVFGLIPAIGLSSTEPGKAIVSSRGTTGTKARVHAAVVVGELALATVLMVSGALLTRSLLALNRVDPGFDAENLLAVNVAVPYQRFQNDSTPDRLQEYFTRVADEIESIPGITHVAVTSNTPLTGDRGNNTLLPEGWDDGPDEGILAERRFVSLNYLETLRIPIVDGRGFDQSDLAEGARTIILTEELAEQAWPGENAVGKRIRHWGAWHTVVGTAGVVRDESLESPTSLAFYVPFLQSGSGIGGFMIRTSGDPTESLNAIRERIWSVYPDLPITRATPVTELMTGSLSEQEYRARLMAAFAVIAAAFATLGIYGVTSRSVNQRSQEMAIRLALGAENSSVLRLILRQGIVIAAIGGAIGVLLSVGAARLFRELLFEVSILDPIAIGTIALFVGAASVLASLPPAVRATRTDPITAMRTE